MMIFIYVVLAIIVAVFLVMKLAPALFVKGVMTIMRKRSGFTHKTLTVDGITWPYLEGGPKDAETLVLIHGFGDSKDTWLDYKRALGNKFHVICPDMPAFGEQETDPDWDYSDTNQVKRLHSFLAALGLKKIHLGGNSMGGGITLRYALDFPEDLATITLFDNIGVKGAKTSEVLIAAARGEKPLSMNSIEDIDALLNLATYDGIKIPKVFKQVMLDAALSRKALHERIFEQLTKIMSDTPMNAELASLQMPALIIWGRHDRLVDVSCVEVMKAEIPENTCVIMEKTGHIPMTERPAESAEAQISFMQKHGYATA